jgi:hypothetical protein
MERLSAEHSQKVKEEMEQAMKQSREQAENQAFREALEATNAQWGVIMPRLRTLLDLRDEAKVAVTIRYATWVTIPETPQGDGGAGSGGASGGPAEQATRRYEDWSWKRPWKEKNKLTRAEQACEDLVSVLEKPNATDEEKRQKLNALRQVKEQTNKELQIARQELREVLTPRLEAKLVLIGVLD